MSLKTWKQEFYPKPASRVAKKNAIKASLLKWAGLRPENLAKHDMVVSHGFVHETEDDEKEFWIGGEDCPLCVHYNVPEECRSPERCGDCPLVIAETAMSPRGEPCDYWTADRTPPYGRWSKHKDPEPMIALLEAALAAQEASHG